MRGSRALVAVVVLVLFAVVSPFVDFDGNPLTVDTPSAALTVTATEHDGIDENTGDAPADRHHRSVLRPWRNTRTKAAAAAARWSAVLRRSHRPARGGIPR